MPGRAANKSKNTKRFLSNVSGFFSSRTPSPSPSATPTVLQSASHDGVPARTDRQTTGSDLNTSAARSLATTTAAGSSSTKPVVQPISASHLTAKAKTALQGVHEILKILERSTDAFPMLKSPVAAINSCIHVHEMVLENREEAERQLEQLREVSGLLEKRAQYGVWPTIADSAKMTKTLDEAATTLRNVSSQDLIAQYAKNSEFTTEIRKCWEDVNAALRQFQLELGIQQERCTSEILKEAVLGRLEQSKDAPYTSASGDDVERQGCTPGTRQHILNQIIDWAKSPNHVPSLFWLYGLAGIGKTAIALTLCENLEEHGYLASSYFCSIQLDSRNSKFIVPTIARHLASISHAFAVQLVSQLQSKPDTAYSTIKRQLEGLLCTPWKSVAAIRATLPPLVVVIDALDECENGLEFLTCLLDSVDLEELQGIRFFVTSRPVPELAEKWQSKAAEGHQIALHDVERHLVDSDIHEYLRTQLEGIESLGLKTDISSLVAASGGLFVFAATIVKYIFPRKHVLTQAQRVRRLQSIQSQAPGTIQGIDHLYARIVKAAFPLSERPTEDEQMEFEEGLSVLHAVISIVEPLSAEVLAELLGINVDLVRSVVNALHSVLYTAADGRIRIFHASFHDFVVEQERSSPHCAVPLTNLFLATKCLQTMNDRLKFNICHLESSFVPDNQVTPPLKQRIIHHIGPLLAYSCQYWWAHWKKCDDEGRRQISLLICAVLWKKGMFWIESMSLLGHLQACKSILEECASRPEVKQSMPDIPPLAKIAAELVSMFISIPPPRITSHLYLSLLASWMEAPVLKEWKFHLHHIPQVLQRKLDGRQYCKMTFNLGSPVRCITLSSHGRRVVSGSEDGTVRFWDFDDATGIHRLEGHTKTVSSVAFSHDGKRALSGSYDGTIRLWDCESSQEIHSFEGLAHSVLSFAFSPNGKQIVFGSNKGTVCIWDAEESREVHRLEGHTYLVFSVAFSSDGKRVVSGSADITIRIWNVEEAKEIHCLRGHGYAVRSVAFSPNGKQVVSGSHDKTIRLWDIEKGKEIHCLLGHAHHVLSVAFSHNGQLVVSGSYDKTIRVWDVQSAQEIHRFGGHVDSVDSVAFLPHDKQVISASIDQTIRLWDIQFAQEFHPLEGNAGSVASVDFAPDGKWVVSGSHDRMIRLWNVENAKDTHCLQGHTSSVHSVAFSHDCKHVVSGSGDATIRIWDIEAAQEIHCLQGHRYSVRSVAFSPNQKQVVSGSEDKTIRLWNVETAEEIHCFEGHTGPILSVAFSPNGKQVVSCSEDKTIRLWEIESVQAILCLEGHTSRVLAVAFPPDGKRVASGSSDGVLCLWDLEDAIEMHRFKDHTSSVSSVAFSPDGKHVISGSHDGTIRIWDVDTAQEIHRFEGHAGMVLSVALSPDGKQIISGSSSDAIRLWDIEAAGEVHRFKDRTGDVQSIAFSPDIRQSLRDTRQETIPISKEGLDNVQGYPSFSAVVFSESQLASSLPSGTLCLRPKGLSYLMRDDGWVVTSKERTGKEEKLLWLPPSLRPFYPPILKVFASSGFNQIDLTDCVFGVGWSRCYVDGNDDGRTDVQGS